MSKYYHNIDSDEFEELRAYKIKDNCDVARYLQDLADNEDDVGFNTSLLHLGMLMQIIAAALNIKKNEIDSLIDANDSSRQRKMEIIIKELNEKINLRYNFDEDVEILKALYTYAGEGYILIDKLYFMDLILNKARDIDALDKI